MGTVHVQVNSGRLCQDGCLNGVCMVADTTAPVTSNAHVTWVRADGAT